MQSRVTAYLKNFRFLRQEAQAPHFREVEEKAGIRHWHMICIQQQHLPEPGMLDGIDIYFPAIQDAVRKLTDPGTLFLKC